MIFTIPLFAQNDDKRVTAEELKKSGTNYFNYSEPGKVNIEINVLGGVRSPGVYLIPEGTTFVELLTLTGNVIEEETADNIKLIRTSKESGKISDNNVITLNYSEIFKDEKLRKIDKNNPVLIHGDIIVVPMNPEKTFLDNYQQFFSIITPILSLATFIISIISISK